MVYFPTQIFVCDTYSPALLDLSLSSDISICFAMIFPPLRNSDHVVVSFFIDFHSDSKAFSYFRTDWPSIHDYLRYI